MGHGEPMFRRAPGSEDSNGAALPQRSPDAPLPGPMQGQRGLIDLTQSPWKSGISRHEAALAAPPTPFIGGGWIAQGGWPELLAIELDALQISGVDLRSAQGVFQLLAGCLPSLMQASKQAFELLQPPPAHTGTAAPDRSPEPGGLPRVDPEGPPSLLAGAEGGMNELTHLNCCSTSVL